MRHILTITTADPADALEVVRVDSGEIIPLYAALFVMNALKAMPVPCARRRDAGVSRPKTITA